MERKPSRRPKLDSGEPPDEDAPLTISPESVVFVIARAKQFDVKDVDTELDPGSNATDDRMVEVLEDEPDDATAQVLTAFIDALSEDEQIDLVALAWLGREDSTIEDWPEVRQQAAEAHNNRTARYLMGIPLLADYLEAGLETLGYSVETLESDSLS
jgi:hypothetical protein